MSNESTAKYCKRSKRRITLLLGASMSGEKLGPLVIGQYENLRCFKNLKQTPAPYISNKKAWMTSALFTQYLIKLNDKFKNQNRRILIFLDNASCHPPLELSNIELVFFPKNTTSVLQPMDQGVIHSFKSIYKRQLIKRSAFLVENFIEMKQIDILDSLLLTKKSWEEVTTQTISNCFKKAGFCIDGKDNLDSDYN